MRSVFFLFCVFLATCVRNALGCAAQEKVRRVTRHEFDFVRFRARQDLGAGEAGRGVQPSGHAPEVHAAQVRHPPAEQQLDRDRDGPQRLHREKQGREEAADGRGSYGSATLTALVRSAR